MLSDAIGAIGCLVFDGGVPPAVEVHDVSGGSQVEPEATRLHGQHEEPHPWILLEAAHEPAALLDRGVTVEDEPRPPEHARQERRQRVGGLAELGEHQRLLLLGGDRLGDLAQPGQLAASLLVPRAVAEPLRRVIADLLEAHEVGQDQPAPLDALPAAGEHAFQLLDGLLIERRLRARQQAERLDLGLVRQIGHDRAVGLETAQEIGLDQAAQRRVRLLGAVGQSLHERRELGRRAEQARVQEVEDRP